MAAPLTNVAIVGATGNIGRALTRALLQTGHHTITAITRANSTAPPPPAGVRVARVNYDDDGGASLAAALAGQQFLAIALQVRYAPGDLHARIVQAAARAGVTYIMPNVYGCDIFNEGLRAEDLVGEAALERCRQVERVGCRYVAMCSGFWYEHSLALGAPFFGIDLRTRTATFFDAGTTPINVSTWPQCGRAFAALLSLPLTGASPCLADWKDAALYLTSFCLSQRDMLDSVQRVTHTTDADWTIAYESSARRYRDGLAELRSGDGMGLVKAMYTRTFFPGGGGEIESTVGTANRVLGLPVEDLDAATRRAVELWEGGYGVT